MFLGILSIYFIFSFDAHVNVDKDITHTVCLQSNTTSPELLIIFPVTFLFLLAWCKPKSDKKVKKNYSFLEVYDFLFLKIKNSSDFFNNMRT